MIIQEHEIDGEPYFAMLLSKKELVFLRVCLGNVTDEMMWEDKSDIRPLLVDVRRPITEIVDTSHVVESHYRGGVTFVRPLKEIIERAVWKKQK